MIISGTCTLRIVQIFSVIIFVNFITPLLAKFVVGNKNVGLVFSPLVRKGDKFNAHTYNIEIVKFMLEIVLNAGYSSVTTYGVGSPYKAYDNQSISNCSNYIHSALAAAEINKSKNYLAMTVYQGLFNSTFEDQMKCEIEVGLKVALQANLLFIGTVPAVVYPSHVNFNDLIDSKHIKATMKNVSSRAHALHMKYGVRVTDCQSIPTRDWRKVKNVLSNCDFIICLETPDESELKFGWENFKCSAILTFLQAEEFLENSANIARRNVELILETRWPGDPVLKSPNSVQDLINYRKDIASWAVKQERKIFIHEAFDTPWKNEDSKWPLAGYFGQWKYNSEEPNLQSKNAYVLKQDYEQPLLINFGWYLLLILMGIISLVALITTITQLFKRVRRVERAASVPNVLDEEDIKMFIEGISDTDEKYGGVLWNRLPYDNQFEMQKNQIKIDKTDAGLLGKGQFGCVYRGEIFMLDGQPQRKEVAVKTHLCYTESALKCILSEIKMLTYIGSHSHVCNILGAYTNEISKGIVYFAMELCTFGNLENYLRKHKSQFEIDLKTIHDPLYKTHEKSDEFTLSETQLVRWSFEIASAMNFISSKNVIHSDLAARNVLLTAEFTTKVTDFGLASFVVDDNPDYTKTGNEPLPWKWLSPESLEFKIFSTKSDVYAYGVTLWELFSLGLSPQYKSVNTWNDLVRYLKAGNRLDQPEYASDEIYNIMTQCWQMEAINRPSFEQVLQSLVLIINSDYRSLTESLCDGF